MNGPTKNAREQLDNRHKWLDRGLHLSGATVVLGLVLEYFKGPLEEIGKALVVAGVGGEVLCGVLLSEFATRIQALADSEVNQAAKQASEANERAAHALERAAKAEQAAADANLERIRLERQMAGRDIPDEQAAAISGRLSKFAEQRIIICCFPLNQETLLFASAVGRVLVQAGWRTEQQVPITAFYPDGIVCAGFSLSSTPDEKSAAAGMALLIEFAPLAGGGCGPLKELTPPEDPRIQMVVQERYLPFKSSVTA